MPAFGRFPACTGMDPCNAAEGGENTPTTTARYNAKSSTTVAGVFLPASCKLQVSPVP